MDDATLRKVQLTQLEIAKEVKRICDKNGIDYFMDGGTLIGAVRHRGFIPWDDDFDFGMIRNQYERFLKIAPHELGEQFFLQTWDNDKGYGLPFAKIRKNGTLYIEEMTEKCSCHQGIFIDIFPYDDLPKDINAQKRQGKILTFLKVLIKAKCNARPAYASRTFEFIKFCKYLPFLISSKIFKKSFLVNRYDSIAQKYDTQNTGVLYCQCSSQYARVTIPTRVFQKTIELAFEDTVFRAPEDYNQYLSNAYGDYMTPPPIDQRGDRHQVKRVEF
mgnify:CR=1 FL=1